MRIAATTRAAAIDALLDWRRAFGAKRLELGINWPMLRSPERLQITWKCLERIFDR